MPENVRVVRVFLASPGDLKEERRAAKGAVDEINATVARPAGYQVDLIGWEDTISAAGRPQGIINEELSSCELFIGMLWSRWGTPPDKAGIYSSGFEEEYHLSRKRLDDTGEPEMKLFFKDVAEAQAKDAGPELQKVLNFRKKIIDQKTILFQNFSDVQELARRIRICISDYIQRLRRRETSSINEELAQPLKPDATSEEPREAAPPDTAMSTDSTFLTQISTKLPMAYEAVTAIDVARLRLIATSISRTGNSEAQLGVHDANLLYMSLNKISFSYREIIGLIKCSLLNLHQENTPLWSWLRNSESTEKDLLTALTVFGRDEERVGAFEALTILRRELSVDGDFSRDWAMSEWFRSTTSTPVRNAALRYLRICGRLDDLEVVEKQINDTNSQNIQTAIEAALAIYLRYDRSGAVRLVFSTSFEKLDPVILKESLSRLDDIADDDLRIGLDHRNPDVRAAALARLGERGSIDQATVKRAASDDSSSVRIQALAILERTEHLLISDIEALLSKPRTSRWDIFTLGNTMDERSKLALETHKKSRLRKMKIPFLEAEALGNSVDRNLAYFVLADRQFSIRKHQLRKAIDDRFRSYYEASREKLDQNNPTEISDPLRAFFPALEEDHRRILIRSALDILTPHRDPKDLRRVRELIDESAMPIREDDIMYLGECGAWDDIPRISKSTMSASRNILADLQHSLVTVAARAISKLSVGREHELLAFKIPGPVLSRIVTRIADTAFSTWLDGRILPFLIHDDDKVRRATSLKIVKTFNKTRIVSIMNSYISREDRRFYNVIFWLDLAVAFPRSVARTVAAHAIETERAEP